MIALEDFGARGEAKVEAAKDAQRALMRRIEEAAYDKGFAAGAAAAEDAFALEQDRLSTQVIEALSDAQLSHTAQRADILAQLAPVLRALAAALVGPLAERGLAETVAERVATHLEDLPAAALTLELPPRHAGPVAALLEARGLAVAVRETEALAGFEARLRWADGFDHIDYDRVAREIDAALSEGETDERRTA